MKLQIKIEKVVLFLLEHLCSIRLITFIIRGSIVVSTPLIGCDRKNRDNITKPKPSYLSRKKANDLFLSNRTRQDKLVKQMDVKLGDC